jgi:hypothetical protein
VKYRWLLSCVALVAVGGGACDESGAPHRPTQRSSDPVREPDAGAASAGHEDAGDEPDASFEADAGTEEDPAAEDAAAEDAAEESDASQEDAATDVVDAESEASASDAAADSLGYGDVEPISSATVPSVTPALAEERLSV